MACRNPASRPTVARHDASERYALTKNDSESSTRPNAPAVCVSAPSVISPEKNRGAATTIGNTLAAWLYPAVSAITFLVRHMMSHQLSASAAKRRFSAAPSAASPRCNAIPSTFSRSRASAKRKFASTRWRRKSSITSGRPTTCVSQVPTNA